MNKQYYTINNWLIDQPSGSILHLVTGESKRLGMYQLKLLDVLLQHAGKIFTREELTTLVWERRVIGNNSLPNAIHALRTALEDDGKQQRIIRTIPKHGYVLEPEFCQLVLKDEVEVNLSPLPKPLEDEDALLVEDTEDTQEREAPCEQSEVLTPLLPATVAVIEHDRQTWWSVPMCWKISLLLLAVVLGVTACWYGLVHHEKTLAPQELAKNVYSHIRLFSLPEQGDNLQDQKTTYSRLKETYYILDQQLKSKSINMSVYYNNVNQTLNYTMRLQNGCEEKLLAMQVYHWRANPGSLNSLILNETQRKINEMASCKAK